MGLGWEERMSKERRRKEGDADGSLEPLSSQATQNPTHGRWSPSSISTCTPPCVPQFP